MPTPKPPYPAQLRQQIIKLVQVGHKPSELAKEFGCHVTTILNWVRHASLRQHCCPRHTIGWCSLECR
jgi:transposase